jgi:hypothetical protein
MTKSTPNLYRRTPEKFSEEPPTIMTALLDCLLPDIERALRSGKRLNEVWRRLSEDGLATQRDSHGGRSLKAWNSESGCDGAKNLERYPARAS